MKTKITVTTVVEIEGVETSYDIFEALKKAFKDVAHVNDELTDDDAQGYSFTFHKNEPVDLKALESKVKKIIDKAHAKELAEEAEAERKAKKSMEGYTGSVLTPVTNKYARMMDCLLKGIDMNIKILIEQKDYRQAEGTWNDMQDLITLRQILNNKSREEAYKYARNLDTFVRESIPDEVYDYMTEKE